METPEAAIRQSHIKLLHLPNGWTGWLKLLLMIIFLALSVHLLLPFFTGFNQTWQTVERLQWWLVALALVAEFASYVGGGFLLQGLVRLGGGRISMVRGSAVNLASTAVGVVAAGVVGSEVSMYAWLHQNKGDSGGTTGAWAAVGLKPIFNNVVLFVGGICGIVYLIFLGDLTSAEFIGLLVFLAILVVISGALIWGAARPDLLARVLTTLEHSWARLRRRPADSDKVDGAIRQATDAWSRLRSGGWKRPMVGAVLYVAFDMCCLALIFLATGETIGLGVLLAAYTLPRLLGKVAIIPGGIGVVEASMITLFTTLGSDGSTAAAVVLTFRLLSFWTPTILGLLVAIVLQRGLSLQHQLPEGPSQSNRAQAVR